VVVGRVVPAAERLGGLVDALLEAAAEQVGAVGESGGVEVAEEGLGLLQPPSCSVLLGVLDPGGGTLAPGDVGLRGEAGLAEAFVESGRRCLGVGPGGGVGDEPRDEAVGHELLAVPGLHRGDDRVDPGSEPFGERRVEVGEQLAAAGELARALGPGGPADEPGEVAHVVTDPEPGVDEGRDGRVEVEHPALDLPVAGEGPGLDEGVGEVGALGQLGGGPGSAEQLADRDPAVERVDPATGGPGEEVVAQRLEVEVGEHDDRSAVALAQRGPDLQRRPGAEHLERRVADRADGLRRGRVGADEHEVGATTVAPSQRSFDDGFELRPRGARRGHRASGWSNSRITLCPWRRASMILSR